MVERRSPKPEVGGSIPSAPAKKIMKNPLKFLQEVKQEAFRITWPTKKRNFHWSIDGFRTCIRSGSFLFIIGSNFKVSIKYCINN